MKFSRSFSLIAFVAARLMVAAGPTSQVKHQIQQAYSRQSAAFAKKDVDSYLAWFTKNYKEVHNEHGDNLQLGRKVLEGHLRQSFHQALKQSRTVHFLALNSVGDLATVRFRLHIQSKLTNPLNGAIVSLVVDAAGTDEWIHSPNGWHIEQTTFTSLKTRSRQISKGREDENEDRFVENPTHPKQPDKPGTTGG
jgi:hypothetical protein